jgi:hypothetical protein
LPGFALEHPLEMSAGQADRLRDIGDAQRIFDMGLEQLDRLADSCGQPVRRAARAFATGTF